jgi:SAM-dependent methyltransferase
VATLKAGALKGGAMKGGAMGAGYLAAALRPFALRSSRRSFSRPSDGEVRLLAQLHEQLPRLHEATLPQFAPIWDAMVDAVAAQQADPRVVLDLASGAGEPALTLARRFPSAEIVVSDKDEGMLTIARRRIAAVFASPPGRVTAHQIDLTSLSTLAGDSGGDGLRCDAVTCSLGLFLLPPAALAPCLSGVHQLLTPGGHLCASVWEGPVPLIELGRRCLNAAL